MPTTSRQPDIPTGGRPPGIRPRQRRSLRRSVGVAAMAALGAVGLLAGAGTAGASPAPHTTSTTSAVTIAAAPTRYGRVLFAGDGHALYYDSFDQTTGPKLPLHSTCTGKCATAWPPLLAPGPDGPFHAAGGVRASQLGTVPRTSANGTTVYQVTYYGQPLYEFVKDTAAYDTNGEDVAAFDVYWHLVAPQGRPDAGPATVSLETSAAGVVLSTPTAFGTERSLYGLTMDPADKSTCTGPCSGIWPPLLSSGRPQLGAGVDAHLLGAIRLPDGTFQLTYAGRPLYLFAFDLGAGAPSGLTNGEYLVDQHAHGVWYTIDPSGQFDPGTAPITSMTDTSASTDVLGMDPPSQFASKPFALYSFSADTTTTSNCTGTCARYWPPVLTSTPPIAASGSGVTQSLLGSIPRSDGTFQVTYDGHPLYFFAFDQPGKTLGAGVKAFGGTFEPVGLSGTPLG
jgi:predicted lipoprotein with Yx(FWY)xxD motif